MTGHSIYRRAYIHESYVQTVPHDTESKSSNGSHNFELVENPFYQLPSRIHKERCEYLDEQFREDNSGKHRNRMLVDD